MSGAGGWRLARGLVLLLALGPATARAQDDEAAREAEMFGEPEPATGTGTEAETGTETEAETETETETETGTGTGTETVTGSGTAPATEPDPAPFGEPLLTDRDIGSRLSDADDPLELGGKLWMRVQGSFDDERPLEESPLSSPNLLDVFLDARPSDRVRGFIRGRLTFDPTVEAGDTDPLLGELDPLDVTLDQLWLKTDVARRVYVTLGRQPIRWGAGHFWNPTDFLNQQARDPLAIFDERLGVTVLKLHVPVESLGWNVYAVADLGGASTPEEVGGAAKAELLFGQTELSLSAALKKDEPLRLGADLSTALWIFDLRVEGAASHGETRSFWRLKDGAPESYSREDDWIAQVAVGGDVSFLYTDQDSVMLGAEVFYNDAGVDDPDLYWLLAMQGDFVPFYLGRHYASAFVLLMGPGTWDDTTVTASAIANISDETWVARLDWRVRVLSYLDANLFGMLHMGDEGGELRYTIDVPAGVLGPDAVHLPAPRLDVGLWLSVAM